MTDTRGSRILEAVARALKAEIARQFDAAPLPGPHALGDWSATGGELNLTEMAQIAIAAYREALKVKS